MKINLRNNIRIYFIYVLAVIKSNMQYKLSFFLMVGGRFLIAFNGFVGIYFLFSKFTNIKGYTCADILICDSLLQISFAVAEAFGGGMASFANTVKGGGFDRMLLRPCSPILQVNGERFQFGKLAPLLSAVVVLGIGIKKSSIAWSIGKVLTILLMIVGGIILFLGIFMIGATICFFSIEDTRAVNMLTYGAREHGKYPVDVYGKGMMRFCTYIIPYALIQYYPLQYLLGRSDHWQYSLYPLGTLLFMTISYTCWRLGMKRYQSCGS